MSVNSAPADGVSAWRGQNCLTEPRKKRASKQNRCPHFTRLLFRDVEARNAARVYAQFMRAKVLNLGAKILERSDHNGYVFDFRNIVQGDGLVGENGGGQTRQCSIFVS